MLWTLRASLILAALVGAFAQLAHGGSQVNLGNCTHSCRDGSKLVNAWDSSTIHPFLWVLNFFPFSKIQAPSYVRHSAPKSCCTYYNEQTNRHRAV